VHSCVEDPERFGADPDKAYYFYADPDPALDPPFLYGHEEMIHQYLLKYGKLLQTMLK